MSEWFDSQKKPSSDFRKLLQEHIDKANPRRTKLTNDEKAKQDMKRILKGEFKSKKAFKDFVKKD
jgi:hypothetical protein|tara:strand:- start:51 stop:245 length:195 start_codon:yes stop_codon:yes gene_type:complete